MLHLILADSELERVPGEIAKHRTIVWQARKRGRRPTELILNSSLHHRAMLGLPDAGRRGRPDIVHSCLQSVLDSPLNSEGLLRTYVHTRNDLVITVDPSASLPRAYNRFEGLMEQLFLTRAVPPGNPLLTLEECSAAELVRRIGPERTLVFSEKGERKRIRDLFANTPKDSDVCAIVGGFPEGDFISDVGGLADEVVSIHSKLLTAPAVIARVICAYEQESGVL